MNASAEASSQQNDGAIRDGVMLAKLVWALGGAVLAAVFAILLANLSGVAAAIGINLIIFLAAFAVGAFLGFLFGVPRVLSNDQASGDQPAPVPADGVPPQPEKQRVSVRERLLRSNTNLERISDWLTTMLVGAGLVELHRANEALFQFRLFLEETATVFGASGAGVIPAIGPLVLVFGAAGGFLFMYLNTRLVLIRVFYSVEAMLAGQLSPEKQRAVRAIMADAGAAESIVRSTFINKVAVTVDDALSGMFDLLYKDNPDRVVELGAQLMSTEAVHRAEFWFYLAAAFGQKLHQASPGSDEWISARDNALDCARRAVTLDPSYRDRLWSISDPNSFDNDLAPLREDPEFLLIVRRRADGSKSS